MIVDLMRNDLAPGLPAGQRDAAPSLMRLESFANVHHLVSTVRGELAAGRDAVDLLRASLPPGSVTGAPKIQAMKVIAGHEPPRGPFFGVMLWAGFDGALDSSVLIRTAGLTEEADPAAGGWKRRAGAGVVADSEPAFQSASETAGEDRRRSSPPSPVTPEPASGRRSALLAGDLARPVGRRARPCGRSWRFIGSRPLGSPSAARRSGHRIRRAADRPRPNPILDPILARPWKPRIWPPPGRQDRGHMRGGGAGRVDRVTFFDPAPAGTLRPHACRRPCAMRGRRCGRPFPSCRRCGNCRRSGSRRHPPRESRAAL